MLDSRVEPERFYVELRALRNDSPPIPPGPEGSNGRGPGPCAADVPKFLHLAPGWFPAR